MNPKFFYRYLQVAHDPDGWWYQKEEGGEWYHTYGTKACMPMYKASVEMRDKIVKIAREVFGND